MTDIAKALTELGVTEWVLRGEPTSKAEFATMYAKVTGADENGSAIFNATQDFTWEQVSAKQSELQAEYDAYVISTDATIADMQENWDAEVASMQAAWDAQVAQLTADAAAAADAASLLLSNTILSYENSLDSLEFSYENEISGINSAHNAQLEEIAYLDSQEDAAYQATIDGLNDDKDGLIADIDGLNSDIDGLNTDLSALTALQSETQASLDHYSNPISIDLQQGWNMIGFQWQNSQDVALSLAELGNSLHLIKNNSAAVYWPEFGFNSLGLSLIHI